MMAAHGGHVSAVLIIQQLLSPGRLLSSCIYMTDIVSVQAPVEAVVSCWNHAFTPC